MTLAVLATPGYRRLLIAIIASEVSLLTFETALLWTILQQTGSAPLVGLLYAGFTLPMLLFVVVSGVVTDRTGPRRPMLISAVAATLTLIGAAALTTRGPLSVEVALLFSIGEGVFFGFWSVPAAAFVVRLVETRLVARAVALTSLQTGAGPLIGGALGGMTLAAGGATLAFAVAAAVFAISVIAVATLPPSAGRVRDATGAPEVGGFAGLASAWRSVARSGTVVALIVIGCTVAGVLMSRFALFPVLAQDALRTDASGLGWLISASGLGAIAGTALTDATGRRIGRGRATLLGLAGGGFGMILLGAGPQLPVALVLAALTALLTVINTATALTLLQLLTPDAVRGRVLALYELVRWSFMPAGSIAGGVIAGAAGVSITFVLFGAIAVVAAVLIAFAASAFTRLDIDDEGRVTSTA